MELETVGVNALRNMNETERRVFREQNGLKFVFGIDPVDELINILEHEEKLKCQIQQ